MGTDVDAMPLDATRYGVCPPEPRLQSNCACTSAMMPRTNCMLPTLTIPTHRASVLLQVKTHFRLKSTVDQPRYPAARGMRSSPL